MPASLEQERLTRLFQELGLTGYEARCLLALLQLGSANAGQISGLSGLPRTAVYPSLDSLSARGLAEQLPGRVITWTSPGRDQVIDRLHAEQVARFRGLEERTTAARQLLDQLGPEQPSRAVPFVHLIRGGAPVHDRYTTLVEGATTEILVTNRPPFALPVKIQPAVLEAVGRGVRARALYREADLGAGAPPGFLDACDAYEAAGVDSRVVADCPVKLAVFDRRIALFGMPDPSGPEGGFPTSAVIEHPGFAAVMADAFERRWDGGRPYRAEVRGLRRSGVAPQPSRGAADQTPRAGTRPRRPAQQPVRRPASG